MKKSQWWLYCIVLLIYSFLRMFSFSFTVIIFCYKEQSMETIVVIYCQPIKNKSIYKY